MEIQKKIGICIPTFEHAELLERALDSIRIQSYKEYIVIISDDSKSECIKELVNQYDDINLHYFCNEYSLGTSSNLNRALSYAIMMNVDYIKILFQDDWFSREDSLEIMIRKLESSNAEVLFVGDYENYPNRRYSRVMEQKKLERIKRKPFTLFSGNFIGAPSVVMYKTCDIMFDPEFTWLLDVDFYFRLLPNREIVYIYEPLINIGHDGDQLSDYYMKNMDEVFEETRKQWKKYKQIHTFNNYRYYFCVIYRKYLMSKCKRLLLGIS